MKSYKHSQRGILLGETMVALAVFFLLFMVVTGASMSAYNASVRMSHKARAEDVLSTSRTRIECNLEDWTPSRSESYEVELGDMAYSVNEDSKMLPDDRLEVKISVVWRYQGQQRSLESYFVRNVEDNS